MRQDIYSLYRTVLHIPVQTFTDDYNSPVVTAVDNRGWNSLIFSMIIGKQGDQISEEKRWRVLMQHANDINSFTPVFQRDVVGAEVGPNGQVLRINGSGPAGSPTNPQATGATFKCGYIGNRKLVRILLRANITFETGTIMGFHFEQGHANRSEDNKRTF